MRKNMTGILYFYIHFIVEVVCFFYLSRVTHNSLVVWSVPFIYDGLAFVPQSIIGYVSDKYPKVNMTIIGCLLFIISILVYSLSNMSIYVSLLFLCLGNAFVHVDGAEVTLRSSKGKLSPSAIFVGGGAFGVISGKLLAMTSIQPLWMILLIISIIPVSILSRCYLTKGSSAKSFDYVKGNINPLIVILIAFIIVVARGYIGYGIPTSWNKTILQNIIFFFTMGLGKVLGGILSDRYGIKKIASISTLLAIPFLCFGDNLMIVSIIGVMFFSMTMSITLGILVSVLKNKPGLAFGITTIGLFTGTMPIFFIKLSVQLNIILIVIISILCFLGFNYVLKGSDKS